MKKTLDYILNLIEECIDIEIDSSCGSWMEIPS